MHELRTSFAAPSKPAYLDWDASRTDEDVPSKRALLSGSSMGMLGPSTTTVIKEPTPTEVCLDVPVHDEQ